MIRQICVLINKICDDNWVVRFNSKPRILQQRRLSDKSSTKKSYRNENKNLIHGKITIQYVYLKWWRNFIY